MGPRTCRWTAWAGWVVLAGCGGAGGGPDTGVPPDDGILHPDIIFQIPETNLDVDPGASDDAGGTADPGLPPDEGVRMDEGFPEDEGLDPEADPSPDEVPPGGEEVAPDPGAGEDAGDAAWTCDDADGSPCDDGDLCTTDDRCQGGECHGKPVPCLDDGIPCTEDRCEAGVCVHPVKPANCLIADRCYKDGDVSLTNSCLYCDAALDAHAWTGATGWTCSDSDPCTVGDECQDGVCVSGVNECVPPDCTHHSECYPERVCGVWYLDGKAHCSLPCAGPADCGTGEICTHAPGSAGVGYCQVTPFSAGGEFGGACEAGAECASALCVLGVCGHFCGGQAACAGGTCFPAGDGTTTVLGACAPNSVYPAGLPFDFACTQDAGKTYDSSLCLSGHCDLMMTPQPRCTRLCVTDSQCAAGQECNLILFSTEPVADSIPFAPEFTAKTHDGVLGCYTVGTGGFKSVGQECTSAPECKTNKCFALTPGNPTKYCTTLCASDSQCPTGWQCKPELATLTDDWLVQAFSQPPKPDAYTLVRLCKPK